MSQFSRRARWINQLFPQSKAPQVSDPGQLSEDVSLVQPYDGSGWGFQHVTARSSIQTGIGTFVNAFETDDNQIFRFLSADALWHAIGLAPSEMVLIMIDLASLSSVNIAKNVIPPSGQPQLHEFLTPIIPPNTRVQFAMIGGDALTQVSWGWQGIMAPLGTVFYL